MMNVRKAIVHCEKPRQRRGAATVYVAISMVVVLGMAALAVDVGMLYVARGELQRTADSSALAACWGLLDEDRIRGGSYATEALDRARDNGIAVAAANPVLSVDPVLDRNNANAPDGDLVLGYIEHPEDREWPMTYSDPATFNSVRVLVRRDDTRNGSISLYFARVFGHFTSDGRAIATATARDGISGYRVTARSGNAQLLPIALHVNAWNNLLNGSVTTGDQYAYSSESGAVTTGTDGVQELNLYPGSGVGQLPPGNFGTVDIGSENNSAADLSRQVRYGVNESDLSYFGGTLSLGDDGYIMLNGDTGLTAAIKDDLQAIIGQPRAIPIFSHVSGNGNNSYFCVTGFVGIRIMYVKLTGAMSQKKVIIQPAICVDGAAIGGNNSNSRYVYQPPELSR
jgi:Flp pilus assembly protein TadG